MPKERSKMWGVAKWVEKDYLTDSDVFPMAFLCPNKRPPIFCHECWKVCTERILWPE